MRARDMHRNFLGCPHILKDEQHHMVQPKQNYPLAVAFRTDIVTLGPARIALFPAGFASFPIRNHAHGHATKVLVKLALHRSR